MRKVIKQLLPKFLKKWINDFRTKKYQQAISEKSVKEVFTYIYKKRIWGKSESISGSGSSEQEAQQIISELPKLFEKYAIKSILDLPCGDFNWMKKINLDGIKYIGGDIVEELINKNQLNFSNENIQFQVLNVIEDSLPDADLVLCRDCFVHLTNEQILMSLENIKKHNFNYLLVTSFPKTNFNQNIMTGQWRPLNMEISPFNLNSIKTINEKKLLSENQISDKSLILIDLNTI